LNFTSTVPFEQFNTDPLSYRTRSIIGVLIGGKAASYNAITDDLAYYKENCIVDNCRFTNIHSPIIATQSSNVRITRNIIYSYNASAIVSWTCPENVEIRDNFIKLGADDGIIVGAMKASQSAWVAAGKECSKVRISNNYVGYTRARCISTGGYSSVLIADNHCESSLLSGIAIFGDQNLFADGAKYNRNIVIDNNHISRAGRFYNTTSLFAYWQGPVSLENVGIGTYAYKGTRGVSTLPRDIIISNNFVENPSGSAILLHSLDNIQLIDNTAVTGIQDQGSGNVGTNGAVVLTFSVTSTIIRDTRSFTRDSVNWLYTYIITNVDLTVGNMFISNNSAVVPETFDPLNETPAGNLVDYVCRVNGNIGSGVTSPTYRMQLFDKSGADRNLIWAAVQGASNGFSVSWKHSTAKMNINMTDLPTSSAGLSSGDLWRNGTVLNIV